MKPASTLQSELHPSPLLVFPSSQSYPGLGSPFPQIWVATLQTDGVPVHIYPA